MYHKSLPTTFSLPSASAIGLPPSHRFMVSFQCSSPLSAELGFFFPRRVLFASLGISGSACSSGAGGAASAVSGSSAGIPMPAVSVCRVIAGFVFCIMGGVTPAATGVCVVVALSSSGSVTDVGPLSGVVGISVCFPPPWPCSVLLLVPPFLSFRPLSHRLQRSSHAAAPHFLYTQLCMACAACSPPCPSLTHIAVGCGLVATLTLYMTIKITATVTYRTKAFLITQCSLLLRFVDFFNVPPTFCDVPIAFFSAQAACVLFWRGATSGLLKCTSHKGRWLRLLPGLLPILLLWHPTTYAWSCFACGVLVLQASHFFLLLLLLSLSQLLRCELLLFPW